MKLQQIREETREWMTAVGEFSRMVFRTRLPKTALALITALLIGGAAITLAEWRGGVFSNLLNSLWWALVTMTTVGYGDMVPTTPLGKAIGVIVILSGVLIISVFTATVSSIFVAAKIREGKGLQQVKYRDHLVICGFSFMAQQVLDALVTMRDHDGFKVVLVADIPSAEADEVIANYQSLNLRFVRGDWTHETVLKRAGANVAHAIIILPDESLVDPHKMDEKTILATLTAKALNPKSRLLTYIKRRDNKVFLQRANADEILVADDFYGFLLAANTMDTGVPQMIKEMLSIEGENQLGSMSVPPEFIGKKFSDLAGHFCGKGSILIGLSREENPLESADILSADTSALDEFIRRKFEEAGMEAADQARINARLNPPGDTTIDKRDRAIIIERLRR